MATMAQFSQNIRKRGSNIENNAARLVRRTARSTLKLLVYHTPVDKGVARSNWRVTIGNQATAKIPAYFPGRHLGLSERANANAAIATGFAKIDQLRPGRGNPLGSALYIRNNVPYIERLNAGYSAQAGAGWVNDAVANAKIIIHNFRLVEYMGGDGEGEE
jgi:hypothetical protein